MSKKTDNNEEETPAPTTQEEKDRETLLDYYANNPCVLCREGRTPHPHGYM